ncbi:MAG TPA: hypothetical protein VMA76_06430 [Solirubrobacteraceae bacterium]|nr:hypothetical protein [Solirubrobacteraceae bacterium]
MTEDIESSSTQPLADAAPSAADSIPLQARIAALTDERPEVAVGAAFAGGLLAAMILKRLGR